MSFLKDLFAPKPGGTVIGNLLRDAANKATDGLLGTGAGRITQKQYDIANLSDEQFIQKYGETKNGVVVPGVVPDGSIKTTEQYYAEAGANTPAGLSAAMGWVKKNIVIVAGVAVAVLVYIINRPKKWGK